jgi:hypothetical protein
MLTLYWPWKAHNASGITRFSGLWVKIKAKRNPFLEAQRRIHLATRRCSLQISLGC